GQKYPAIALPANYELGDNFSSQDVRVTKTFRFKERVDLRLIGEVFNIFNISNLSNFNFNLAGPFGVPSQRVGQTFGSGGPRAFQIAGRLSFYPPSWRRTRLARWLSRERLSGKKRDCSTTLAREPRAAPGLKAINRSPRRIAAFDLSRGLMAPNVMAGSTLPGAAKRVLLLSYPAVKSTAKINAPRSGRRRIGIQSIKSP